MWIKIGVGFVVLILATIAYLATLGLFSRVVLEEKSMSALSFAYEDAVGPYSKSGAVFKRVSQELTKLSIPHKQAVGVYHDDPRQVPQEKLRSQLGIVLADGLSPAQLSRIRDRLKVGSIPATLAVVAEFPMKNMLSFIVGPMKVYPAIERHMLDRRLSSGGPSYELYDETAGKILYIMPARPGLP